MGDFTKKELEDILNCCECTISEYETKSDKMENVYALHKKIQSMIDTYCEHDYKKTLDKSGMYFISLCHKCMDSKPWDGE